MDLTSTSPFSFLFAQPLPKRTPSPLDWYPPLETPKKQINLLQISQNLWILRNGREKHTISKKWTPYRIWTKG